VFGELTAHEIELLTAISMLGPSAQRDLEDYLKYQLCKQYKREVMVTIFHNQLLHSLLHSLLHLVEREDYEISQVEKRMKQINELYFGLFEQIHTKYSELIPDLDSNELVKEFGKNSFENISRACMGNDRNMVRIEIIDFFECFNRFTKKKDVRKIVAV
jgi:hypothetical protein